MNITDLDRYSLTLASQVLARLGYTSEADALIRILEASYELDIERGEV